MQIGHQCLHTSTFHPNLSNSPTAARWVTRGQKRPERAKIRYFVVFRPDYWSNTPNKWFTESGDVQNTSRVHPKLSNSPTQPPDGFTGARKGQKGPERAKYVISWFFDQITGQIHLTSGLQSLETCRTHQESTLNSQTARHSHQMGSQGPERARKGQKGPNTLFRGFSTRLLVKYT